MSNVAAIITSPTMQKDAGKTLHTTAEYAKNPHDAIMGAAVYLASLGAPTDMHRALYGYNPNDGYVGAVDAYARNMLADPRAIYGYHSWEVYVTTSAGTVRLPIGFSSSVPQDAAAYVATHPQDVSPVRD